MYEIKNNTAFGELALLFIKLQQIELKMGTGHELNNDEYDIFKYRDIEVARALLREDEQFAINVANIITTTRK